MKLPIGRVLLTGTLLCGCLVVWSATAAHTAKQCLDGQLHADFDGAAMTERGCEVTTTAGETLVVPIFPPFEAGVAGGLGLVVLGTAAVFTLALRPRRRPVDRRQP